MTPEDRLRALYDRLPKMDCKRLCEDQCGPVPVTHLELAIAQRSAGGTLPSSGSTDCPLITEDGCCSIYADRPLVCRLWGTYHFADLQLPEGMTEHARGWRCPHGCRPERELTVLELVAILAELESFAGPAAARSLVPEINAALVQAEEKSGGRVASFGLDPEQGSLTGRVLTACWCLRAAAGWPTRRGCSVRSAPAEPTRYPPALGDFYGGRLRGSERRRSGAGHRLDQEALVHGREMPGLWWRRLGVAAACGFAPRGVSRRDRHRRPAKDWPPRSTRIPQGATDLHQLRIHDPVRCIEHRPTAARVNRCRCQRVAVGQQYARPLRTEGRWSRPYERSAG